MISNKLRHIEIYIVFLLFMLSPVLSKDLMADRNGATLVNISNKGRISQFIKSLENCVNEPSRFNFDIVSQGILGIDKDIVFSKIRHFDESKLEFDKEFIFNVHQFVLLQTKSITEAGNMYFVEIGMTFRANNFKGDSTISAYLFFDRNMPRLSEPSVLIDLINDIIDHFRIIAADVLVEDSPWLAKDDYSIDDLFSPNLIVPRPLFESLFLTVDRFTKNESIDLFEAVIFNRPYDIMGVGIYNSDLDLINQGSFVCDQTWVKIEGRGSGTQGLWHLIAGGLGGGLLQFRDPMSIEFIPPSAIVVADARNNRAMIYHVNLNSGYLTFVDSLTNNYNYAADVASAYIWGEPNTREVAVLDCGNNRVDIYDIASDYTATRRYSMFSTGSGINQINGASSICYAKQPFSQYNLPYIFVADNGNRRIIRQDTDDPIPTRFETTTLDFPSNTFITSISIDNFGYVYAVDRYNSKIYVFNTSLEFVASYGSYGIGDNELYNPISLKFGEGYINGYSPLCLCDLSVVEDFGPNSGIRRYTPGLDILWANASVIHNSPYIFYDLAMEYYQTGASNTLWKTYFNGQLIDQSYNEWELPGDHQSPWIYVEYNTGHHGYYRFETEISPLCQAVPETILVDSLFLAFPRPPIGLHANECHIFENEPAVKLDWEHDLNGCDCTVYEVFRDNSLLATISGSETSWIDSNSVTGQIYWYKIRSRYGSEYYSEFTPEILAAPAGAYQPAAPSNPDAVQTSSLCYWTITWEDNSINEEQFYIHITYYDPDMMPHNRQDHIYVDSNTTITSYNYNKNGIELHFDIYALDSTCESQGWPPPDQVCDGVDVICSPAASMSRIVGVCQPIQCPFLYVWANDEFQIENNLLSISAVEPSTKADFIEYHQISVTPEESGNEFKFRIEESGGDTTYLDHLELLMVDKKLNENVIIDNSSGFYNTVNKIQPSNAVDHKGNNVTHLVMNRDGNSYFSGEPGYLIIDFDSLSPPPKGSKIDEDGGSITVRPPKGDTPNEDKGGMSGRDDEAGSKLEIFAWQNDDWVLLETIYGLAFESEPVYIPASSRIDSKGELKLKYQWNYAYRADEIVYIQTKPFDEPPIVLALSEATHSASGDVLTELTASDDNRITINPGDILSFAFANPTGISAENRKFVLRVEGSYTPGESERPVKETSPVDTALIPRQFAFEQNYPNPFNPTTTFSFSLPKSSNVELYIYNILGQKVSTLINKPYPAGNHGLTWQADNLGSGIYFAKFKAGSFTSTRKVVVLK